MSRDGEAHVGRGNAEREIFLCRSCSHSTSLIRVEKPSYSECLSGKRGRVFDQSGVQNRSGFVREADMSRKQEPNVYLFAGSHRCGVVVGLAAGACRSCGWRYLSALLLLSGKGGQASRS